jgi:serine/threonine protein kinase
VSILGSLSAERWRTLEPLIDAALALQSDSRQSFLRDACASDAAMYDDLVQMLARVDHVASNASVLERSAAEAFGSLIADPGNDAHFRSALADRYAIDTEVGQGGMAVVYRARDLRHRRHVALKVLRGTMGKESKDRFRREVALAATLQHPNVLPVFDSGESGGRMWYTMPFVDGETLRARLRHQPPLTLAEAIRLLREIADGLACAHARCIVHRDLKPENILLSGSHAVIADFGIATGLLDAAIGATPPSEPPAGDVESSMMGTPLYMAPEQATPGTAVDERADVYAFGVIAYELVNGRAPFADRPRRALSAARSTQIPLPLSQLRPGVPKALSALVARCLAKQPADRPRSASEVLRALDGVTVPSPGRRAKPLVAITAALAVVTAMTIYQMRRPATDDENTVVAIPFQNLTGDSSLSLIGPLTAMAISQGLAQVGSLRAASSLTTAAAFDVQVNGNNLRARAHELGAGLAIWGSYSRRGDSLQFHAQIIRVATDAVYRSVDDVVGLAADPTRSIEELRDRLLGALEMRTWLDRRPRAHMPRIAAFREFMNASERFGHRQFREAIPMLERSIALDSTFEPALLLLAFSHENLAATRRDEWALADSIARVVEARRDVSRSDRALSDYLRAEINGDFETCYRIIRDESQRDSLWLSLYLAGLNADRTNRPRAAVAALLAAGPAPDGWTGGLANLTTAYHQLGDFEKELQAGRQGNVVYAVVRAAAASGNVTLVRAMLDSIERTSIDTVNTPANWMYDAAVELRTHGDIVDANAMLVRARAWLTSRPPDEEVRRRARRRLAADVLFALGRVDSARARYIELATSDTTDIPARGRAGTTAARLGDTLTAARVSNELSRLRILYMHGSNTYWRAAIAATIGEKELAVRLLRQSFSEGISMSGGVHRQQEFLSLRGYAPFDDLMRPR